MVSRSRTRLVVLGTVLAVAAGSAGVAVVGGHRVQASAQASYDVAAHPRPDPARMTHDQLMRATPDSVAEAILADRGTVTRSDRTGKPLSFRITTYNTLGSQHTGPGGDALDAAPGRIRAEWGTDLINSYGSSIVGMQEVQADQLDAFLKASGGRFAAWPGSALGGAGVPQSMIWNTAIWTATYEDSITVPFVGKTRPQPVVRLKNKATGRQIYVINVHNSPKDRHGRQPERDKAMSIEISVVKRLRQDGLPVFILGDFNEHARVFCRFTSATSLVAAQGGSNGSGGCHPPRQMRVDWIFGAPGGLFSNFVLDQSPLVRRATDHSISTTEVSIP